MVLLALCLLAAPVPASPILRSFELRLDDLVFGDSATFPASVDLSGFDVVSGLGVVRVAVGSGAGSRSVLAFFDHDIDATLNTFFNETGAVSGAVPPGLAWEIDEPGFVRGDLYDNFLAGALDNAIGASTFGQTVFPDDVAIGLGWNFALSPGETALVSFFVSTSAPASFHLIHADPDSDTALFATSALTIVPEPDSAILLGLALAGFAAARRSWSARAYRPLQAIR